MYDSRLRLFVPHVVFNHYAVAGTEEAIKSHKPVQEVSMERSSLHRWPKKNLHHPSCLHPVPVGRCLKLSTFVEPLWREVFRSRCMLLVDFGIEGSATRRISPKGALMAIVSSGSISCRPGEGHDSTLPCGMTKDPYVQSPFSYSAPKSCVRGTQRWVPCPMPAAHNSQTSPNPSTADTHATQLLL